MLFARLFERTIDKSMKYTMLGNRYHEVYDTLNGIPRRLLNGMSR